MYSEPAIICSIEGNKSAIAIDWRGSGLTNAAKLSDCVGWISVAHPALHPVDTLKGTSALRLSSLQLIEAKLHIDNRNPLNQGS
jgi:hypothetical protein